MNYKALLNLLLRPFVFLLLLSGQALAGEEAYTQAAFEQLQKEGQPTLVSIHADWCPVCRAQAPIVSKLLERDAYRGTHALRVDFDKQKEAVKAFKATMQSTLIVFKGGHEVGRSIGDTSEAGIEALLKKAL
jgi:thioredoxin 1